MSAPVVNQSLTPNEPSAGDLVEIVDATTHDVPVGSRYIVNGVFDGVLAPGRYLDLAGCPITPLVWRVKIVELSGKTG